jgi:hypothetical protein
LVRHLYCLSTQKKYGIIHDIIIFEKESIIGGKCKDLMNKYPGGAIQFPHYEYFGKVLKENGINLVKKYKSQNEYIKGATKAVLTFLTKVYLYRTQEKYNNVLVSKLFSLNELHIIKLIIENYGYKEMTMFYLYQYIDSFCNVIVILEILKNIIFNIELPHFLKTSILKLMKEMTKDISIITNCKVKNIEKTREKYNVISSSDVYNNLDIIVFSNIVNKNYKNIVPKEVIKECKKITYTKYASALLNKYECELLKQNMLFSIDIHDDEKYKICYFYDIKCLSLIPESRKNIVENYFPRFAEPSKSQTLINSFQGKKNIFYTGGYLSFELIESICVHIQNIILPEMHKIMKLCPQSSK